jgi:RimJ/RimL family protein N-acetyltransferase
MSMVFHSERLIYRRLDRADAAFLHTLMNSPGWLEFIGDRQIGSSSDAEKYIQEKIIPVCKESWSGTYLLVRRTDGARLGTVGIYQREGLDVPDLGFALMPAYQHQGYAREAALWSIKLARVAELTLLSAIALPRNYASIRLLESLGFVHCGERQLPGGTDTLSYFECRLDE